MEEDRGHRPSWSQATTAVFNAQARRAVTKLLDLKRIKLMRHRGVCSWVEYRRGVELASLSDDWAVAPRLAALPPGRKGACRADIRRYLSILPGEVFRNTAGMAYLGCWAGLREA